MNARNNICVKAGMICTLLALILAAILNFPTIGEKILSFQAPYGEEEVLLKGSLWEAPNAKYAVLICPGYSCDRQKWRPMADLFRANGLTVMTFDYSGQGASMGTIGFDNAKTDRIPEQIDAALETLHNRTGIEYDHIILVGHSMGGRSILRLFYDYNSEFGQGPKAETRVVKKDVRNAILLSPEVNYEFNAQASLFAGTSDDAEEPWHSYCPEYVQGVNIWLFGSRQDDIVSAADIAGIYQHIGGDVDVELAAGGRGVFETSIFGLGASRAMRIGTGVLHSYMMYSPKFARMVNEAVQDITGSPAKYPADMMRLIYLAWFLALAGVGFWLKGINGNAADEAGANKTGKMAAETRNSCMDTAGPTLVHPGKFLRWKALCWLPGIVAALLICTICVVMPFGSPVMNIPYMCFIAGYGFVMLFAYRKGKFPGTEGKLPAIGWKKAENEDLCDNRTAGFKTWKDLLPAAIMLFTIWYVLRSSMYRLIPLNARLFWVCFAAVMMTVAYYVSDCENEMLDRAGASNGVRFLYNLIQYVPLLLLVLFYMVLKSYSGMIGQIQNMILMYVFCVPMGTHIRKLTGNRLLGGLTTGFLFQTLMITSAALIAMF